MKSESDSKKRSRWMGIVFLHCSLCLAAAGLVHSSGCDVDTRLSGIGLVGAWFLLGLFAAIAVSGWRGQKRRALSGVAVAVRLLLALSLSLVCQLVSRMMTPTDAASFMAESRWREMQGFILGIVSLLSAIFLAIYLGAICQILYTTVVSRNSSKPDSDDVAHTGK